MRRCAERITLPQDNLPHIHAHPSRNMDLHAAPCIQPRRQSHGIRSSVGAAAGLTATLPVGPLTCLELGGVWSGMLRCGMVRCGMVRCGMAWHGVVWCGAVRAWQRRNAS